MEFEIKNFRSIQDQSIKIGPITVVYGPNGSGKSSLLYAVLSLKSVLMNPNQRASDFFKYFFTSLGGFEQVVYDHRVEEPAAAEQHRADLEKSSYVAESVEQRIAVRFANNAEGGRVSCRVAIGQREGTFELEFEAEGGERHRAELPVTFPYRADQSRLFTVVCGGGELPVEWDGIVARVDEGNTKPELEQEARKLRRLLNSPVEILRKTSIVPFNRGFSKPYYARGPAPVSAQLESEDQAASLLAEERSLTIKVSEYLKAALGRELHVNRVPETGFFSLDCTDVRAGVASNLVNDGFGINQTVYFLAQCLRRDSELVCVEEPEIHLHPSAVRQVAGAFARMAKEEGKHFLISTHSEALLSALLALVARGELDPTSLACYLARKEKKATTFEPQRVTEKGQVEGGLTSFVEAELEDVRAFLGVKE